MPTAIVAIDSIAAGGDGVARVDGLVVFVPRTAPGDRAEVVLTPSGRFARGRVLQLIDASPVRAEPMCEHYLHDRCGGCQLQHLRYEAQLEAKAGIVRDAIQRIAKRVGSLTPRVHASDRQWRYRRKLTLALRRRTREGSESGESTRRPMPVWRAGLHRYDAPWEIFELHDCPITDERVVAIWRDIMVASHLLPNAPSLRGAVRLDAGGATFVLQGGEQWTRGRDLAARVPALTSVWYASEHGTPILVYERDASRDAAASFAQVNATVARELEAYVLSRARTHEPHTVIDAYAGVGTVAAALAEDGCVVTAIEADRAAAAAAASRLPAGSKVIAGTVESYLATALPADVVILNPPRGGLHTAVTAALEQASPPPRALLYASCNPATLARDLARMPSYRLTSVESFDMFPQTAHVETVCELMMDR